MKTYVRTKLEVGNTALDILVVGVVEVTVHNLLGESEWPLEPVWGVRRVEGTEKKRDLPLADDSKVILDALVVDVDIGLKAGHGDLGGPNGLRGGGEACGQPLDGARGSPGRGGEVHHGEEEEGVEETADGLASDEGDQVEGGKTREA